MTTLSNGFKGLLRARYVPQFSGIHLRGLHVLFMVFPAPGFDGTESSVKVSPTRQTLHWVSSPAWR